MAYSSNHQPILLLPDMQLGDATLLRRGPPCFHFEEQWVTDEECEHIIQAGWYLRNLMWLISPVMLNVYHLGNNRNSAI